ncbi:MAG TPA: hypothetical protein PK431_01485 [Chitinophagales bacterium]|nr:hypothetical protein [Chitinophagales bacterium]
MFVEVLTRYANSQVSAEIAADHLGIKKRKLTNLNNNNMALDKHWTKFLPEVGRGITIKGDDQEMLHGRIKRLERELSRLALEHASQEGFLFDEVRENWTIEEITEAKEKANMKID